MFALPSPPLLRLLSLIPLLFMVMLAACAQAAPRETGSDAALLPIRVVTGSGEHRYMVEVARTPEEMARGLMYRQEMAQDRGMIFPHDPPRRASFWMKNTYLPLDMIFIGTDGRIESVAADTVPLSTSSYSSQGPVAAVLELNAGEAERIGAEPGDRVLYNLQPQ